MINKFTQEELLKIKPTLEKVDDYHYVVHKQQQVIITPHIGSYYLIKLANYIINPSSNFTLADNWNNGIVPKSQYFKCCLVQIIGKMLQFDCTACDPVTDAVVDESYKGIWFPAAGVEFIKEL